MSLTSLDILERSTLLHPAFSRPDELSARPFAKDLAELWPEVGQSAFCQDWKNLGCERSAGIYAQDLLGLAFELEGAGHTSVALKVFAYLSADTRFPEAIRARAQNQAGLWEGKGSLGARTAHWLRFLPMEMSRGETAAGLLLGAGGFGLGLRMGRRFFAGAQGVQRALGVSATALAGEATAMSLGYGAVQSYHGQSPDVAGLWTHSLAMSSAYRGMGFLLARLTHLPLPTSFMRSWGRTSPVVRQELSKFSGILGVEALMQGSGLNLGGNSTSQDIWFNSATTYFNLALHHGLFASVAPGRGKAPMPELSQRAFRWPRLTRRPRRALLKARELLFAGGVYGIAGKGNRFPSVNVIKSQKVALPKGPVVSLAQGGGSDGRAAEKTQRLPTRSNSEGSQAGQGDSGYDIIRLGGWEGLKMVLENPDASVRHDIFEGRPVVFELLTGRSSLEFGKTKIAGILNDMVRNADPEVHREITIKFSEDPSTSIKMVSAAEYRYFHESEPSPSS